MAIRINEPLGLLNKITRAMFCSVVAGKYNLMFFFTEKAVDACREVVGGTDTQYKNDYLCVRKLYSTHISFHLELHLCHI